jgi:hypothetical protein
MNTGLAGSSTFRSTHPASQYDTIAYQVPPISRTSKSWLVGKSPKALTSAVGQSSIPVSDSHTGLAGSPMSKKSRSPSFPSMLSMAMAYALSPSIHPMTLCAS